MIVKIKKKNIFFFLSKTTSNTITKIKKTDTGKNKNIENLKEQD